MKPGSSGHHSRDANHGGAKGLGEKRADGQGKQKNKPDAELCGSELSGSDHRICGIDSRIAGERSLLDDVCEVGRLDREKFMEGAHTDRLQIWTETCSPRIS